MGNKIRIKQIDLQGIFSASNQVNILSASNYAQFVTQLDTTMSSDAELAAVSSSISQSIYTINRVIGSGLVSGSSQLTSSYDTRYILSGSITQTTWDNISGKPAGLVSESTDLTSLNQFTSSIQTQVDGISAQTSSYLTSSGSVDYSDITNIPSGIVSQSTDLAHLNSFTSSYYTDSSSFDTRIGNEKGRIDAILSASSADKDSFAEIVSLINSVDLTNDNAFATFYTSSNSRISSLENSTGSYETKGSGILSGSVSYLDLINIPSGIVSQSIDLSSLNSFTQSIDSRVDSLENATGSYLTSLNGALSSSSQLTGSFDERYTLSGSVQPLPDGLVSGSSQLTASYDTRYALSASYLTSIDGAISSSDQLTGSFDTRYTLSGSVQPLPFGLVSSSQQITNFGFISSSQIIDTGSFLTTSSYQTDSSSFDNRINNLVSAGVPAGTVSGSSQLTSSYDQRYTLSGSVPSLPIGLVSSSQQITDFGFISSSADITSLNLFSASYYADSSSIDVKLLNLQNNTSSYETIGRGIISESVVYISDTAPNVEIGNLWYNSNIGNLYLYYDTNTWIDTSNGVIQTIISDGSLLSTASFNAWTASYTASVPNGTVSGSIQLTSSLDTRYELQGRGIISGSIQLTSSFETTGRGIISSSAQLVSLGYVQNGGNATFNSVTANQYIVSSSVYYVTQSYSSGSTIFGNTSDDTHQFTGSVSISGSLTASLSNGYFWVGNSSDKTYEVPTASFATSASFNSFTSSYLIDSASAATSRTATSASLVTFQASLGVTSTPFNYSSVVNPTNYVLVSYPTASFNGGSMDIIITRPSDSTAVSVNCLLASFGGTGTIAANGSRNSGAGAPNPSFNLILSGSNMNIVTSVSAGTYNIKGVARLF